MKIKCIAIDDEPLALELIEEAIERVDYFELLGTFHSVSEALQFLGETKLDCVFLDIEMPHLNGIEFSKIINQFSEKPAVVFVTAYNQYAMKEYQIDSIGFLLKPFSFQDFLEIVEKVKKAIQLQRSQTQNIEPFFIKVEAEQVKIVPQEVIYLESMGDYVKIYLEGQRRPLIPLITLKKIKNYFPPSLFLQINRSQVVNIEKIDSYTTNGLSISEKDFTVSNSFRDEFDMIKKLML